MEKIKSLKLSKLTNIIKCCLLGIIVTLAGIVIFAVVLKFTDLSTNVISYVNNIIKAISIFFMVWCIGRSGKEKLLIKSVIAGIVYAVLTSLIFAILNKSFALDFSIILDILYAVIVAIVCCIILKLLFRKN